MGMINDWERQAKCRDSDPETLYVPGHKQNDAKRICKGCPVRAECLATALDRDEEYGVWGGQTERERRAMIKKNPNVSSWWQMFEAALSAQRVSPGLA